MQLISRHWIIGDAGGEVREVRGLGSSGSNPCCNPVRCSNIPAVASPKTPVGTMKGSYRLWRPTALPSTPGIPEFTLAMPRVLH